MNLGSPLVLGVIALTLFGLFYWLKIFAWLTAILGFLGIILLGANGLVGRLTADGVHVFEGLIGHVAGLAFGVAGVGLAAVILTVWLGGIFIHDLHPKNSAGRRTHHVGLALGVVLVAGATGIAALAGAPGAIDHAVTALVSAL